MSVYVRECVGEVLGWMDEGRDVHTSCNSQHSHDADDGGVDRQRSLLNLLQCDAHD